MSNSLAITGQAMLDSVVLVLDTIDNGVAALDTIWVNEVESGALRKDVESAISFWEQFADKWQQRSDDLRCVLSPVAIALWSVLLLAVRFAGRQCARVVAYWQDRGSAQFQSVVDWLQFVSLVAAIAVVVVGAIAVAGTIKGWRQVREVMFPQALVR